MFASWSRCHAASGTTCRFPHHRVRRQGDTVDSAHLVIGDATGAASAYVGMTRGRHSNVAHLVAESAEDARRHWIEVFSRDRADLGPTRAAGQAAEDIDRYGLQAPRRSTALQATLLNPRSRRPEELHPARAPHAGPGIRR